MKKAFTLIEVIILFVIFLMVALLVIPLSVDDTIQARHVVKWRQVHADLLIIPSSVKTFSGDDEIDFQNFMTALIKIHPLNKVVSYKIKYMNGEQPTEHYTFDEIYSTNAGASLAFKWLDTPIQNNNKYILGLLMYDVNGRRSPNIWGKDIFGMYIYKNSIEAFGAGMGKDEIEFDCSKQGTGLYCSENYLNGGSF